MSGEGIRWRAAEYLTTQSWLLSFSASWQRNGITPLGGFLARMYTIDKDAVKVRLARDHR